MAKLLVISVCGAAGAVGRYLTSLVCVRLLGTNFAYGTLLVNVAGCFLLGLVMHLLQSETINLSEHTQLGITVGFLGALTTFSTFGYETVLHLEKGQWVLAGTNVVANLVLGLTAAAGGIVVARWIS